ncbi:hypothetical protein F2Q69_00046002 [Brassica cretica]|uniref:Uncharacterized protein n=1 Tax=Brassica cretica TaxID=69181 RepID=A0A8S9PSE5_BRACR|nr:hypothetical protein F2Q69_00046002 [Brassica cretica]
MRSQSITDELGAHMAGHTHGPDSPYGRLGRSVGTSEWVRVAKGHELPRGTCVQRVLVPKGCDFQTVTVVQGLGRTKWTVRGCIVEQTDDSFNRSVVSQGRIGCKAIRFGLGPYSVVWIQALARIRRDYGRSGYGWMVLAAKAK